MTFMTIHAPIHTGPSASHPPLPSRTNGVPAALSWSSPTPRPLKARHELLHAQHTPATWEHHSLHEQGGGGQLQHTYLPGGVPVVVLVLLAQGVLLRVGVLDLLVGHLLTDTLEETPRGHGREHAQSGHLGWSQWDSPPEWEGPPALRLHPGLTASISLSAFHCS